MSHNDFIFSLKSDYKEMKKRCDYVHDFSNNLIQLRKKALVSPSRFYINAVISSDEAILKLMHTAFSRVLHLLRIEFNYKVLLSFSKCYRVHLLLS